MIGSLTLMFTEPQHILLATYVFVLATILGAVVLLTLDKR